MAAQWPARKVGTEGIDIYGPLPLAIDDILKPGDAISDTKRQAANEWFGNTLYSRLDDKQNDVIIIVMQRVHVDDLVGHLLVQGGDWVHLNLPAITEERQRIPIGPGEFYYREVGEILHPAREPLFVLEGIKAQMGSMAFFGAIPAVPSSTRRQPRQMGLVPDL